VEGRPVNYCPYCKNEAGGAGCGDESLDWCYECDLCIEGQTITEDEVRLEKEREATKKYGFNWFTVYSRSTATGGVS